MSTLIKQPEKFSRADLASKRIGVVGFGLKTGVALSNFLTSQRCAHVIYDKRPKEQLNESITALGFTDFCEFKFADEIFDWIEGLDLLVTSPGVPLTEVIFSKASALGIPVVGEIEFASWYIQAPIIAITGTNGKSTTASLVHQLLQQAGQHVFLGGNFGNPLITATEESWDYVVAEVSSFQLETIVNFRPQISVLLNISPDHLDRHGDIELYQAIKARIFENQFPREWAIVNGDDPRCMSAVERTRPSKLAFSLNRKDLPIYKDGNDLCVVQANQQPPIRFDLSTFPLRGEHNVANLMAALAVGMILGIDAECIGRFITQAKAPAHRLEFVGNINKVDYINDSKSTTVASTMEAIRSFKSPLVLILGGRGKGADFSQLTGSLCSAAIEEVVAYGESADAIKKALADSTKIRVSTETEFDKAIALACSLAKPGCTVLLSPAAASQDQFTNFEARGDRFRQFVQELGA